jgi:hypothetical protein
LVERLVYTERVSGSSPLPPTMLKNKRKSSTKSSLNRRLFAPNPLSIRRVDPKHIPQVLGRMVTVDRLDGRFGRSKGARVRFNGRPRCTAHVANVCRRTCGVTSGPSPAALRAVSHEFRMLPHFVSHVTTYDPPCFFHRRRWPASRSDIGTGGRRFELSDSPMPWR